MNQIINFIYPPVCGICGKVSTNWICNKCKNKIKSQHEFIIENYKNNTSFFDEHIYMFCYSGKIREAILNYKFNEKSYIYHMFLAILKNNKKKLDEIKKYDIIMPVPISRKRLKLRGYNQSDIFAKELAKLYNINYDNKIIFKVKDNPAQSELNKYERINNVKNVYKIKNTIKIKNKNVLVVDDIFTTGNTVNEVSKILKKNKAKKIGVFTIAKD